MPIHVKNLRYDEDNGYILFTAVIDGKKEIECASMIQDVVIESDDMDKDLYETIWKFGDEIRKIIHKNANNVLAEYEGRMI